MQINITDTQQVVLTAAFADKKGNAASVDGAPVWTSSDPSVATVTAAADGLTATVVAVTEGQVTISVDADADLGSGVQSITGTLDVVIGPGVAVVAGVTAGTPTEQP